MKQFIIKHKFVMLCTVITLLLGFKACSSIPKHNIFSPEGILEALEIELPGFEVEDSSIHPIEDTLYDHFEYKINFSTEEADYILAQLEKLECDTIQEGVYRRDVFQKSYEYLSEPDRVYSIILVPAEGKACIRFQGNAANGSEEYGVMTRAALWTFAFCGWIGILLVVFFVKGIVWVCKKR